MTLLLLHHIFDKTNEVRTLNSVNAAKSPAILLNNIHTKLIYQLGWYTQQKYDLSGQSSYTLSDGISSYFLDKYGFTTGILLSLLL